MKIPFVNRTNELAELSKLYKKCGMVVIYGRRRMGKTRLLTEWISKYNGLYSQAIEGAKEIQVCQMFDDFKHKLGSSIVPKTWSELWTLIDLSPIKGPICIDEFPYLVESDPTLPSIFQRWFDHRKNHNVFILLSGSSQRMMHGTFLSKNAPLYGRADKVIRLEPMDYYHFCSACKLNAKDKDSFIKYSLVGGIPKYWEFLDEKRGAIELADDLYFGFAPYMENEPYKILSDEKISGMMAINLLEVIGRGAKKPAEMASKLSTVQTNISRPIHLLTDLSIISREIPFGESQRTTKKSLYSIIDPTIRFWFNVYSPHRSRWRNYTKKQKYNLLVSHASTVFEDYCRTKFDCCGRYWEKNIEFDIVAQGRTKSDIIIAEVKFNYLNQKEKEQVIFKLNQKYKLSKLSKKYKNAEFQILDLNVLA